MLPERIAPEDLRDFARSFGWDVLPEALADGRYVMNHPDIARRQVNFPMQADSLGYEEASHLALEKLAEIHNLRMADALDRVRMVGDDLIRFRVASAHATDESLPLRFAARMLRGVEELLLSAACTVLRPLTHHPDLYLREAGQLLEHAQLRHTQRGSFVLQVSCPVAVVAMPASQAAPGAPTSFVRASMVAVQDGVRALVRAIESDTVEAFVQSLEAAPSPVVTSNLCAALGRLHDERIQNSIDLSFHWSSKIPLRTGHAPVEVIRIRSEHFERIEAVRRALRPVEHGRNRVFVASVVQLDGTGGSAAGGGEVVVALLHEGEALRARLLLGPQAYQRAVLAYRNPPAFVRIEGRMATGPEPRTFEHVASFTLVGPP